MTDLTNVSTEDLVRELARREEVERIGVRKYAQIDYDDEYEYDECGNSYSSGLPLGVTGPATILVVRGSE